MKARSISDISRLLNAKGNISLLDKLTVYQHVSRVWRSHLTPYEIVVTGYIVDRSVGWGKNHFTAAHGNILRGNEEYAGIGMKERTYFRTLSSLEQKGLIRRRNRRDCVTIALDVNWQCDQVR